MNININYSQLKSNVDYFSSGMEKKKKKGTGKIHCSCRIILAGYL